MNNLYIIPKDIGNILDNSERIKDSIKRVAFIVCEDTRVIGQFFRRMGIEKKELVSFTEYNQREKTPYIIKRIKDGSDCGFMSDAGTPLISDPGFYLVREAVRENINIIPIPGPSSPITALIGSGLPTDSFTFYGFLPKKSGKRMEKLKSALLRKETSIFFESPYRIDKTVDELIAIEPERYIVIGRELTKDYQEYIRGSCIEVKEKKWNRKGEIVLMIEGAKDV